jgi:hypothetical protein
MLHHNIRFLTGSTSDSYSASLPIICCCFVFVDVYFSYGDFVLFHSLPYLLLFFTYPFAPVACTYSVVQCHFYCIEPLLYSIGRTTTKHQTSDSKHFSISHNDSVSMKIYTICSMKIEGADENTCQICKALFQHKHSSSIFSSKILYYKRYVSILSPSCCHYF